MYVLMTREHAIAWLTGFCSRSEAWATRKLDEYISELEKTQDTPRGGWMFDAWDMGDLLNREVSVS